jgi:hypothetical protein
MKVITALEDIDNNNRISVFLAGGITDCPDWQSEVIKYLRHYEINNKLDLVVYNPRRKFFDIYKDDPQEQIKWEYNAINKVDIFSIYFCGSKSVQPICLYELGVKIGEYKDLCDISTEDINNRLIVSVENEYSRRTDVMVQAFYACPHLTVLVNANPVSHAKLIIDRYNKLVKGL